MASEGYRHRLGWLGTGRMGFELTRRLLAAGCDVTVYNRTRAKAEPLAGLGAKIAGSAADLGGLDIQRDVDPDGTGPPVAREIKCLLQMITDRRWGGDGERRSDVGPTGPVGPVAPVTPMGPPTQMPLFSRARNTLNAQGPRAGCSARYTSAVPPSPTRSRRSLRESRPWRDPTLRA